MKVTQEKLPDSQIGLEIEIPAEASKKTYEKVVTNLQRTANIPGFRKGKVPRQILLQRLGNNYIKAATLEELIQDSLKTALKQESIESLGNYQPRFNFDELIQNFNPGEAITFSVAVDVPPTVELGDYTQLAITAEETPYDAKQVDDWLLERQNQQATLVPVEDRPAELGDVAIVDYQAYATDEAGEKSEPIANVQGSDFRVDLVEGRFLEGMVEGIVGISLEESKDIALKFPDDYPNETLAGQQAIFTITLKELKAKELPDLDDDFAEEVSEFETFAELHASLEKRFQDEATEETKNSIHAAILNKLSEICSVDLPETMIQDEVSRILTQSAMQMEQMGLDIRHIFTGDNIPKLRANTRPDAVERLKQTLILEEIAKTESIEPEATAIDDKIKQLMSQYSERDIDQDKLREAIKEELTAEATLNWLQEKATLELVPKGTLNPPTEATQATETVEEILTPTEGVEVEAVDVEAVEMPSEQ